MEANHTAHPCKPNSLVPFDLICRGLFCFWLILLKDGQFKAIFRFIWTLDLTFLDVTSEFGDARISCGSLRWVEEIDVTEHSGHYWLINCVVKAPGWDCLKYSLHSGHDAQVFWYSLQISEGNGVLLWREALYSKESSDGLDKQMILVLTGIRILTPFYCPAEHFLAKQDTQQIRIQVGNDTGTSDLIHATKWTR